MRRTKLSALLAAIAALGMGACATAATLNLDVNRNGDANSINYSGTAQAPDTGTVWNDWTNPADDTILTHTLTGVMDSTGAVTASDITIRQIDQDQKLRVWRNDDVAKGNPTPVDLMSEYLYAWGLYEVEITNLPAGPYALYAYGHGDGESGQNGVFTLDAANGGAVGELTNDGEYRNIYQSGRVEALGNSYLRLWGNVAADGGSFKFTTTYLNGFQLYQAPEPTGLALGLAAGLLVLGRRRS